MDILTLDIKIAPKPGFIHQYNIQKATINQRLTWFKNQRRQDVVYFGKYGCALATFCCAQCFLNIENSHVALQKEPSRFF